MGIYGYLCCKTCKKFFGMGKAIRLPPDFDKVACYHSGPTDSPPNAENPILTMVLWKFLAEHHGHSIQTLFDYEFDHFVDREDYRMIGGECDGDTSFEEYLKGVD